MPDDYIRKSYFEHKNQFQIQNQKRDETWAGIRTAFQILVLMLVLASIGLSVFLSTQKEKIIMENSK